MIEFLTEPLGYSFFRFGLAAAIMAGALCSLVGVYVVLRNMSYIGHGLSHAIFGGAVSGYVLGAGIYAGAAVFGIGGALAIAWIARRRIIGADAAIGIVSTAAFALGVAIISTRQRFTRSFEATLFGNILAVGKVELVALGIAAVLTAGVIFAMYRQLLYTTFDRDIAQASGVPVSLVEIGFSVVLAVVLIASMQILGVTLIAASVVIPPSIARLLTHSFGKLMLFSVAGGVISGAVGMYASFYLNISSGATIVLTATAIFAVVYAVSAVTYRPRRTIGQPNR
jgi:ABC-type Mn2+/Zn2+ transport system permease subunit